MKKVCVLGAGTMGAGIAQVFAVNGFEVVLRDIEQKFVDNGLGLIEKNLGRLVSKGKEIFPNQGQNHNLPLNYRK